MATLSRILHALLLTASILALVSITVAVTGLIRLESSVGAAVSTLASEEKILPAQLIAELDKQATGARADLNHQLGSAVSVVDARLAGIQGSVELAQRQTGELEQAATDVLQHADRTTLPAADAILQNKDIPGVVRDARFTLAFAGQTMRHIDTVSNEVAKATPQLVVSATNVSASTAGIAKDVRKVTDDLVAPKPWWKKAWTLLMDASSFKALL